MKKLLTLVSSLALLTACNNADSGASTTTGSSDSVHAPSPPSTTDSSDLHTPSATETGEYPTVTPGDVVESVIPPEESDSLKFCYISKWTEQDGKTLIDADYLQFYYGDKALKEAKKRNDAEVSVVDGDTTYSVPSDIYMVNENKRMRQLIVSEDVHCFTIAAGDGKMVLLQTSLQTLRKNWTQDRIYILLLDKNNAVTAIKEQYLP